VQSRGSSGTPARCRPETVDPERPGPGSRHPSLPACPILLPQALRSVGDQSACPVPRLVLSFWSPRRKWVISDQAVVDDAKILCKRIANQRSGGICPGTLVTTAVFSKIYSKL